MGRKIDPVERAERDTMRCNAIIELIKDHIDQAKRCPTNQEMEYLLEDGFWSVAPYLAMLRAAGRIRVELYSVNYRVIVITERGLYHGKSTLAKNGSKPYLVLG